MKTNVTNGTDAYSLLADFIVLQAVSDYRAALRKLSLNSGNRRAKLTVDNCEEFFASKWFGVLCTLDPEWLVRTIKWECENDDSQRIHGTMQVC